MFDGSGKVVPFLPKATLRVAEKFERGLYDEAISSLDREQVHMYIFYKWRPFLSPCEYDLVLYILCRTIFEGLPCFVDTFKNIFEGTDEYRGVKMSWTVFQRVLRGLKEKGVIRHSTKDDFVCLSANLMWEPEVHDV
jgi:hypothetical protein